MNSLAKGKRAELEYKKKMEARGLICYKPVWSRFSTMKDIFNLFDIIGINKDVVELVQVKSNRCPKKVQEQIKAFPVPKNVKKIIAIRIDGGVWIELAS